MKKLSSRKSLFLLVVIALNLLNALVGIFGNVVSDDIKAFLVRTSIWHYRIQITGGLIVFGVLAAGWKFKSERHVTEDEVSTNDIPDSEKARRELAADLARRYRERNQHKLDGRYEISLLVSDDIKGTSPQQFDDRFISEFDGRCTAAHIVERFERQGRLLIVGNPGSGKTFLLLALAQHLAENALADATQPLPLVLNLDSWSPDYARFDDWIKAMLTKGYGISLSFADELLANRGIVFLLDGLDELAHNEEGTRAAEIRAECLTSVDTFLSNGTMRVIICCRREQFIEMLHHTGVLLPVGAVMSVQDLTLDQIERALIRASGTVEDRFAAQHLLTALGREGNDIYTEVLSNPFYFSTALQVFDSTNPPRIDSRNKHLLETRLIGAFVDKKLRVTPNHGHFSKAQTHDWLRWLSEFLSKRQSVTFELSDLQPSDLTKIWKYQLLFCMSFAAFAAVSLKGFRLNLETLISGLSMTLIGSQMISEGFGEIIVKPLRSWPTWRIILKQGSWVGLIFGAATISNQLTSSAAGYGFLTTNDIMRFISISIMASIVAVGFATFMLIDGRFVACLMRGSVASNITTEDFAQWTLNPLKRRDTWNKLWRQDWDAVVTGAVMGSCAAPFAIYFLFGGAPHRSGDDLLLFCWLVFTLALHAVIGGLMGALIGVIVGMILGVFRACRQTTRFAKIRTPYQRLRTGIAFNMLQLMLIAAVVLCLASVLWSISVKTLPPLNQFVSVPSTLILYCSFGFFRTALFKHFVLRVCLTQEGTMPRRYASFLSYATDLRILERDGGQWRFRHQILQDYFALRAGASPLPDSETARLE